MSRASGPGFFLQVGDGGLTPATGGGSTTLAAPAASGTTNIKVTAITGFTTGDRIAIGTAPNQQVRTITTVGTLGAGGTGIDFAGAPLTRSVPTAAPVVEVNPEVFTTIAEVKDIKGPAIKKEVIDVTNQSSPGGWEEIITSIKRTGEVTFPCNFNPTDPTLDQTTGLLADLSGNSTTPRNFQLLLNDDDDTMWAFAGFVVGFDETAPVLGVLSADVTIKVSGPPVLGPQA
jgi:hypothetical protein